MRKTKRKQKAKCRKQNINLRLEPSGMAAGF